MRGGNPNIVHLLQRSIPESLLLFGSDHIEGHQQTFIPGIPATAVSHKS
jgi:hypothetical protein